MDVSNTGGWLWNRVREISTWVGGVMILSAQWGVTSTNPSVQQGIEVWNHVAPVVGGMLAGASTKHP